MPHVLGVCTRPDCDVATTGQCAAEAATPAACRSFSPTSVSRQTAGDEADGREYHLPTNAGQVELPRGEALQPTHADPVTKHDVTRVVVIAGAPDSDKTTLVASLYERFGRGRFAGFTFAGSRTLLGFERRCHASRDASGRPVPDTPRTSLSEGQQFLHLRLRGDDENQGIRDLLLSDISGEEFLAIINSNADARRVEVVRRADHFVILIDGDKLVLDSRRQEAHANGVAILRSLRELNMLTNASRVDVLFTKWDILGNSGAAPRAFRDRVQADISARFGHLLRRLRFFDLAARDPTGTLAPAFNMERVLPAWVVESPCGLAARLHALVEPTHLCEFDRFYRRTMPDVFAERIK